MQNNIFSIDEAKAAKSQKFGWLDAIHYMAPYDLAGVGNLCPHSTAGCRSLCLGEFSGQAAIHRPGELSRTQQSRRAKAVRFMTDRAAYLQDIARAIALACKKAAQRDLKIAVRLNGSTDIAWEGIKVPLTVQTSNTINRHTLALNPHHYVAPGNYRNMMAVFPFVQFMDYTKSVQRCRRDLPENYHLTFSRSETNEQEGMDLVTSWRANMAVVFDAVPETYKGLPVIDGDLHDLRHLDAPGCIVGLAPKGRQAKRDQSGFVLRLQGAA